MFNIDNSRIGIIGLGYVGLPLAVEFGKQLPTIGLDINEKRIAELKSGTDSTLELKPEQLAQASMLTFTTQVRDIESCNIYIITVPTPVDKLKRPDLSPLQAASKLVGQILKGDDVVIFESTVYPGATEEICVPVLEAASNLTYNRDFFVGYSPERINPGDKKHGLTSILKITAGSTPEVANLVDTLYQKIITAGTHKATSIRVAEAAKVIENIQRDVNIALINELAQIFHKVGIDTLEVLEAAETKWNFLPFRPGLVGGHCIGVDPYYLTHKAQEAGYQPNIIPSSRRINDGMGEYVADRVIKLMASRKINIVEANILILGFAFKENCPDLRNTRVIDIIEALKTLHANIEVYDPWVVAEDAHREYSIELINEPMQNHYDAIILAVAHEQFAQMSVNGIRAYGKKNSILFDVKYVLPKNQVDGRL